MRIDKQQLLADANCIDVAKYIGIDVVTRGANQYILCPGHVKNLGRPDNKIGNCVLYPDGYICFSCNPNKKNDVFTMVQEHMGCSFSEALSIVADIYGGAEFYKDNTVGKVEKLPLSTEDLKLIGLLASSKNMSPINGSYEHFDATEGTYIEKIENEYLCMQVPSAYSLLNLRRDNEEFFNVLIRTKARESYKKYEQCLAEFGSRIAPKAGVVYDLFNEDGGISDSVFMGIQNAIKKKMWRCQEIEEQFKKE